jgi:hypothetical protein
MLEELSDKFSTEEVRICEDGSVVELSRREPHVEEVTQARTRGKETKVRQRILGEF